MNSAHLAIDYVWQKWVGLLGLDTAMLKCPTGHRTSLTAIDGQLDNRQKAETLHV